MRSEQEELEKKIFLMEHSVQFLGDDLERVRRIIVETLSDIQAFNPEDFPFVIDTVYQQLRLASKLLDACLSVAEMEARLTEERRLLLRNKRLKENRISEG